MVPWPERARSKGTRASDDRPPGRRGYPPARAQTAVVRSRTRAHEPRWAARVTRATWDASADARAPCTASSSVLWAACGRPGWRPRCIQTCNVLVEIPAMAQATSAGRPARSAVTILSWVVSAFSFNGRATFRRRDCGCPAAVAWP
jgi:hypothetical protein